jgi:putative DNA primase/helicase
VPARRPDPIPPARFAATADLVRRTLRCGLDSDMENPEQRVFLSDPVATVLRDRAPYVAACLTVARAYIAAGRPSPCRSLASFAAWSDLVRSALVWLGWPDPVESMDMARCEDPMRQARTALFDAWVSEIGLPPAGLQTAQLVQATSEPGPGGYLNPAFREAALTIARDRTGLGVSPERLAKWLRSTANVRVGNMKLTINRRDAARPRWVLQRVEQ